MIIIQVFEQIFFIALALCFIFFSSLLFCNALLFHANTTQWQLLNHVFYKRMRPHLLDYRLCKHQYVPWNFKSLHQYILMVYLVSKLISDLKFIFIRILLRNLYLFRIKQVLLYHQL